MRLKTLSFTRICLDYETYFNKIMKCKYIYTEQGEKILIPGCMAVAVSGRMEDCTCRSEKTFVQFEREEYNKTVNALRQEVKELEKENAQLNRIIKKLTRRKNNHENQ